MIVAVPVDEHGHVGHSWGRAHTVAIARVTGDSVTDWHEYPVGWDVLHDQGSEGAHHARVVKFLREHEVSGVALSHVGPGMQRMMATMGIYLVTGASGDATEAVIALARDAETEPEYPNK